MTAAEALKRRGAIVPAMIHYGAFMIDGEMLRCAHCAAGQFVHRPAEAAGAAPESLGNLAWLAAADVYACRACGHLHFFLPDIVTEMDRRSAPREEAENAAENIPEDDPSETHCLACGVRMSARSDTCSACGWSYAR